MPKYSHTRTKNANKTRVYHWTREETIENAKADGQKTCVIDGEEIDCST